MKPHVSTATKKATAPQMAGIVGFAMAAKAEAVE